MKIQDTPQRQLSAETKPLPLNKLIKRPSPGFLGAQGRTQTTPLLLFLLLLLVLVLVLPLARFTIHALFVLLETVDPDQSGPSAEISSLMMQEADPD